MNVYTRTSIAAGIILAAMASSLSANAQDPFQSLKKYDPQDRKSLIAIRKMIQEAGLDRMKQATLESGLIAVLDDANGNLAGKQEAAKFLWIIGSGKSVPALSRMLGKPETNDIARYALEHNPDPSAASALRSALKASSGTELVGIVNSIGDRADVGSVDSLKSYTGNSDSVVSDAAITALGKIGTPSAIKILSNIKPPTLVTENAILRAFDKATATATPALSEKDFMMLVGPNNPYAIRAGALAGLASIKSPRTSSTALNIAKTASEPTLQRTAGRIAVSSASPADDQRALAAWPSMPSSVQIAMLNAWADKKDVSAASVAMTALKSDEADVRVAGIRSSIKLCDASVVPSLIDIASGGDQANVARENLAMMSGPKVESMLIESAMTGKRESRNAAINILANRTTQASTNALITIGGSNDPAVSPTALKALGRTAGIDREGKLVEILTAAKDDGIRDSAQTAVVAIIQRSGDTNRGADVLISQFAKANDAGKSSLLAALAELGGSHALSLFSESLVSGDSTVKSAAASALSDTWQDGSALPLLLDLAKNGKSKAERVQPLRGYFRIVGAEDRVGDDQRLTRVKNGLAIAERPEEKNQALSILRRIRSSGSIAVAGSLVSDPDVENEAASAVLDLATERRRGNTTIPAVKGDAANAALDRVIRTTKDKAIKDKAEEIRHP
ncbi:MAG: hypothetical protein ABJA67_15255 [Chthonomonadales bacterium]